MKPSGSSRRRQRSPTSRRSTCRDRASRQSRRGGVEGKVAPSTHTEGWGKRNRTQVEHLGGQGLMRVHGPGAWVVPAGAETCPTCGWGSLSRTCWRGGAQCGASAPRAGGCGARGGAGDGGLATVGRPGSRLAGGLGCGGAAACALGGCVRLAAPPAAESPRVRFKLLSNSLAESAAQSRGVRSRTLLPPPALPFFHA